MGIRIALIAMVLGALSCTTESPSTPDTKPLDTTPTTPTDPTDPVDPNQIQDVEFGMTTRPSNSTCVAVSRPQVSANLQLQVAYSGVSFSRPLLALQEPGDSTRWYVLEQSGRIYWFDATSGSPTKTTFLDIRSAVLSYADSFPGYADELGLLGMAFDPDYQTNGYVYLSYTVSAGGSSVVSKITRFTVNADGNSLDASSETQILSLNQPYSNHNGGHILFGPDGYLYIGFGDGGSGGDPHDNGQNKNNLLATILRIDVHGTPPYSIPADNPFVGVAGEDEIWAYGLRNPWRFEFDLDGTLWAGDVGQNAYEEVDIIVKGGNYGWRIREAAHCYNPANCDPTGLIDPVAEYGRNLGQSITGGFVYRGSALPGLQGAYIYGDYGTGNIWSLTANGSGGYDAERILNNTGHYISSFVQDHDGELYILSFTNGKMYKLVGETTVDTSTFPALLTQTGCAHPQNLRQGSAGMIPYDVNIPFWSDGAEKYRWMGVPDGMQITLNPFGDFIFPLGTVLRKDFYAEDILVETRLMMYHQDGDWAGYVYRWRADGSDADWIQDGASVSAGSKVWNIPSDSLCLQCHTSASGRSLSAEVLQLNKSFVYSGNLRANQLNTLSHIGILSGLGNVEPTRRVSLDSSTSLEQRVRSYLHVNCSNCHQPGSTGGGAMDFLFDAASMNVCGATPNHGDLDIAGAQLVFPGEPTKSILLERIKRLDDKRMPPIATSVVDQEGVALIQEWISSLSSCP